MSKIILGLFFIFTSMPSFANVLFVPRLEAEKVFNLVVSTGEIINHKVYIEDPKQFAKSKLDELNMFEGYSKPQKYNASSVTASNKNFICNQQNTLVFYPEYFNIGPLEAFKIIQTGLTGFADMSVIVSSYSCFKKKIL